MFDVLELCEQRDGRFVFEPGVIYPATIARIREVLAGEAPVEIVSAGWKGNPHREPVAGKFLDQAGALPMKAWDWALMPLEEAVAEDKKLDPKQVREVRARALGLADNWFTRALLLATPGKRHALLITRDDDYRR